MKFNDDCTRITAMVSSAGEEVTLENSVVVSEKVEDWLELLAQEMRATLASLLAKCLKSKSFDWGYPSQVLCLAQQIKFTDEAEAAIEEGGSALKRLHDALISNLRGYTSQDLSCEPLLQLKMKSLVLDVVHHIDVTELLIKKNIGKLSDWTWHKQIRYYHEKSKALVRMCDAEFEYTHEYQGNAPKLVHTPLTDKCYLTLTMGMHMGFGGNPYGPAGFHIIVLQDASFILSFIQVRGRPSQSRLSPPASEDKCWYSIAMKASTSCRWAESSSGSSSAERGVDVHSQTNLFAFFKSNLFRLFR